MDIHRSRFVRYAPSAVNSLAFSHTSGTSSSQPLRLAIGRADGSIEIWNPLRGAWAHETTIHGGKGRSVEALVWIHDPDVVDVDHESGKSFRHYGRARLFSIGYSSAVTEWDLITGRPRTESSGVGGEVWCLAAQPKEMAGKSDGGKKDKKRKRDANQNGTDAASTMENQGGDSGPVSECQHLVAGCADGTLVLLSTADDDLVFVKYIARASKKNARPLSLAFQDRHTIVAGFADSTIRVYDIRTGALIRNMSLGAGPTGAPKEKLVWAVECLKDGTVVSGDSSGEVVFWDGKTYGQLQRVKGHEADVLCLTSSEDGQVVFSGGMDRRTCVYNLSGDRDGGQRRRWMKTTHRRFHQHDVKAMARFDSAKMSVVVSGGLDTTPILIPLREFGTEYHRVLPFVPQLPPVTGTGRLVASWKGNEVAIWRIKKRGEIAQGDAMPEEPYQIMSRLVLKGDEYIATAAMASSGNLLAVSTAAETKLFQLRHSKSGVIKVRKVDDAPKELMSTGSRILSFSLDSKWLLTVSPDNRIRIARIASTTDAEGKQRISVAPEILTLHRHRREEPVQTSLNGTWGSYTRTTIRTAFSSDSRILAVSDLAGHIDIFVLEGKDDGATGQEGRTTEPPVQGVVAPLSPPDSDANSSDGGSASDSDTSASAAAVRKSRRHTGLRGQRWTLAPSSRLFPRLPSHALIFSFRPSSRPSPSPNSNTHQAEDRLLILTATHTLHEHHALTGTLTPWSRHNPSALLPPEFKLQRDRALGCIWDVAAPAQQPHTPPDGRQRLWVYAASWLAMMDLGCDFARPPAEAASTGEGEAPSTMVAMTAHKRQREESRGQRRTAEALGRKAGTTGGAGSTMPLGERGGGVYGDVEGGVRRMEAGSGKGRGKGKGEEGAQGWEDVHVERRHLVTAGKGVQEAEGEDEEDEDGAQTYVRPAHPQTAAGFDGDGAPAFYLTTRYRPILGMVALSDSSSFSAGSSGDVGADVGVTGAGSGPRKNVEVALIERPFWDLGLPARFVGAQEWGDK